MKGLTHASRIFLCTLAIVGSLHAAIAKEPIIPVSARPEAFVTRSLVSLLQLTEAQANRLTKLEHSYRLRLQRAGAFGIFNNEEKTRKILRLYTADVQKVLTPAQYKAYLSYLKKLGRV